MKPEEMCRIFDTNIDLEYMEQRLDKGIHEFYVVNNKSIGISYETHEGETGYIFNLFVGKEYVNIDGFYKSVFDAVDTVTEAWNRAEKTRYHYMFSSYSEVNCGEKEDKNKSTLLIHIGKALADKDEKSIMVAMQPTTIRLPDNIEDILERNKPKEPIEIEDDDGIEEEMQLMRYTRECPTCHYHFYGKSLRLFCSNCGQRFM